MIGYAVKVRKGKQKTFRIHGRDRLVDIDVWVQATNPIKLTEKLTKAKLFFNKEEAVEVAFNVSSWSPFFFRKPQVREVKERKGGLTSRAVV